MLKIDFTNEMIFGFEGPNLCLLGTEDDFRNLSKAILPLTSAKSAHRVDVTALPFVEIAGDKVKVVFSSGEGSCTFGHIIDNTTVSFELDNRYWERIFVFFALMSWDKKTFYLNSFEDYLRDLPLDQEVHFICSSEF